MIAQIALVPKLHLGTHLSAKLCFFLTEATKLRGQLRSQIKFGNEGKAILGDPTTSDTGSALGISVTTYTYHTNTSDVKITFLNDKVMATEGVFK